MIDDLLQETEANMKASVDALEGALAAIRTGRASPALVEKVSVEYYGQPTPLIQLASISVPEPRSLLIKPYDAGALNDIEKAIQASDLGLTPNNDGKAIRLNLPVLTEDRRKELVKVVSGRLEEARVSVRNTRRDSIKDMREYEQEKMISEDDLKRGEEAAQKLTDDYTLLINKIGIKKETEVMEV
ncbi:MAG: ribosome recycling factor [Chloroflexota bacterium]